MPGGYETLETVVPGVILCRFPKLPNIHVRVYRKDSRTYTSRSTGKRTEPEAKAWVLENLGTLFQIEVEERGGGTNSIQRLLTEHLEYLRKRYETGQISEGTFIVYEKETRHFKQWFIANNYKRIADIKKLSLSDYPLDRVHKDGYELSTANLEATFVLMWWKYLMDNDIVQRHIIVNKLKPAIEKRTAGEPFSTGDLEEIYNQIDLWIEEPEPEKIKMRLPTRYVSKYNRQLFRLFTLMLDETGCRQHEIMRLTWKDIKVHMTNSKRQRIINEIKVPHKAKRGFRVQIFQGESLFEIKRLHKKMCDDVSEKDFIFRNEQTNTLIDASTFSRYWVDMNERAEVKYKMHTLRSHRITQLVLSGVEAELVARNLGLSVTQLMRTYLRFVPAAHFDELVMRDRKENRELRTLISHQAVPLLEPKEEVSSTTL